VKEEDQGGREGDLAGGMCVSLSFGSRCGPRTRNVTEGGRSRGAGEKRAGGSGGGGGAGGFYFGAGSSSGTGGGGGLEMKADSEVTSEETGKLVTSSSESDSERKTRAGGRERERREGGGGRGREGGGGGMHGGAAEGKRHWDMSVAAHGGNGHGIQPGTQPGEDMAARTAKARPTAFDMSLLDAEFSREGAGGGGSTRGGAQVGAIGHRDKRRAEMFNVPSQASSGSSVGSSAGSSVGGVGSTPASRRATRSRIAHFFEL
jgi:hypothetical protein